MMGIENTGERIIVEKETPLMIARHLCAYRFARDYVNGKDVLDIGCGEGYGSHYLAGNARCVKGVDYDGQIVSYARNRYTKDNLGFEVMDIKDLRHLERTFDCICCFQVIEHIRETGMFLQGVRAVLGDSGTFICSTPNRVDASPGSIQPYNKFHVKEYLLFEFKELLASNFGEVAIFGLKRSRQLNFFRRIKKIGLFNFLPDSLDPVKRFYGRIGCDDFFFTEANLETSLDFIAVCKK
jgi:SAM-dependent methyltransferase